MQSMRKLPFYLAPAMLCAAALSVHAQPASKGATPASSASKDSTLYWYDGDTRRELRIDASNLARFGAQAKSARAADVIVPAEFARKDVGPSETVSPLLRDEAGRPRALPGGVIVTLPADMTEQEARQQLEALGVQPLRAIGAGTRMWLVAAEPGLASLQLANRLHETGRVSAQPNWWQPRAKK